jgi:hypothetical protein
MARGKFSLVMLGFRARDTGWEERPERQEEREGGEE